MNPLAVKLLDNRLYIVCSRGGVQLSGPLLACAVGVKARKSILFTELSPEVERKKIQLSD